MQGVAAVKYGGPWEKRGIEFTLQCERKMGLHGAGGGEHFKEPFQTNTSFSFTST